MGKRKARGERKRNFAKENGSRFTKIKKVLIKNKSNW